MTDQSDILATGRATQAQLGKLFRRDKATVARLMADVPPVGRRGEYKLYDIGEAAAALVKPSYDIEDRLRTMNQADLPPLLNKEFWNGQRARKTFESESGNLWPTEEIVAVFARVFGSVTMSLKLMLDKVERETSVSTRQREILKRLTEGTINQTREIINETFKDYPLPDDNIGRNGLGDEL